MAEHDLTATHLRYLDRHLAFPLLQRLQELEIYPQEQITKAQYELAKETKMVDYAVELFKQSFPGQEVPKEFDQRRQDALDQNERLQEQANALLDVIENPEVAQNLRQDKVQNLAYLKEHYGVTNEQIYALYESGQFQFSCGSYGVASSYLYHYRVLTTENTHYLSSLWGKLASDVLTGAWDNALEELNLLREAIESGRYSDSPTHQLNQRTWLLHWSLFVWWNHPKGREGLVEMFFAPQYLNAVQVASWWLLRYLAAALIMTRRTTRTFTIINPPTFANPNNPNAPLNTKLSPAAAIRDLVRIIGQESYRLKDPVTDFVRELYTDFDFKKAQEELKKAERVVQEDFFLQEYADDFIENARFLVSEAYCRIHQRIDIADLSARLNMSQEEGEKWIVNLIRDTRADAKIDLKENTVLMNQSHPPVYQSVIEKTRGFTFRTAAIGQAMDRRAHPPDQQQNGVGARGEGREGGRGGRGGRGGGGRGGGRGGGARGGQGRAEGEQQQQQQRQQQAPGESAGAPTNVPAQVGVEA